MIWFRVVGNDVFDFLRVNDRSDSFKKFVFKTLFHAVDEGDLVRHDEECVVGRSLQSRISVKVADVPVDRAYPVD